MSRVRVELPSHFIFKTSIPVRITDLNYGGHVGNDTILSLVHEARVQFLQHFGYTEMQFAGCSLIMSDAAIEFRSELFYGSKLAVHVAPGNPSRAGFDIFYKLVKENDIVVATAKTGMVCFDYGQRKVVSLPTEARTNIGF